MQRQEKRESATRYLRRRAVLRAGVTGGAAAALLVACGGDEKAKPADRATGAGTPGTAAAQQSQKPQRGGTLTLAVQSQFGNLHPRGVGGSDLVRDFVYDRLFNYDYENGTYELSAASTLEQPDPLRVVFKLKPAAKFQQLPPTNGRQLTSEDCSEGWSTYAANPRSVGAKQIWTQETDRVETPDPSTVIVVLKRPNSWVIGPHGLAGPYPSLITPRELNGGDQLEKVAVGSGGYHLGRFDPTAELAFVRRPDGWHDDRPYIDRVVYKVISDETARAAAFRAKQIDQLVARDKLQADEFKTFGADIVIDRILSFPRMMWMRADRPPFNDVRVLQAIYLTLDIKELIERMDLGEGEYSGIVPPYLKSWSLPEAELKAQFPVDRPRAQGLLRAAGYDTSAELRHKLPNDPKSLILAELVQKQLAAIGIKTRLIPEDPNTVYQQTISNSDFDLSTAERRVRGQDGNLWVSTFSDKMAGNGTPSKWTDAEIDALIDKQRGVLDTKQRDALVLEIQRLYFKKFSPGINLFSPYDFIGRWSYYHPVNDRGYVGLLAHHRWTEKKS